LVGKIGRTRTLYLSDAIRTFVLIVLFGVLYISPEANWFLPLSIGSGACSFLYSQSFIALESSFPQTVEKSDLHQAQALLQASEQGASFLGPLAAGLMSASIAKEFLIPMAAILFGLASLNTFILRNRLQILEPKVTQVGVTVISWYSKAREGFAIVLRETQLISMVVVALFLNLLIGGTMALNPGIVKGLFKVSDSVFGTLNGAVGLLSISALILVPVITRKISLQSLVRVSLASIYLFSAALSLLGNFWSHLASFAGIIAATMLFNVYMRTTRAKLVTSEQLPSVIASMVFLNQLAMPISGFVVSVLGTHHSAPSILRIILAISLSGMASGIYMLVRAERRSEGFIYVAN
jgi:hypothetical protein